MSLDHVIASYNFGQIYSNVGMSLDNAGSINWQSYVTANLPYWLFVQFIL